MKGDKFNFHFHGPVGEHIDTVKEMTVIIDINNQPNYSNEKGK